ncbi:MAG TPA: ABC transporter ATP-binding protein [Hyphomicrobiaceae bacterium]|nr:ABC transporter ATP-binding protein [Hyphomicrobiaceae bacterium]
MSLSVENVNAYYGNFHVLQGVSLLVEQGTIHVLLGRNGAGKTTTLRTIFGLMDKWTGSISLDGVQIGGKQPHLITRAGLAYVPEYRGVFSGLSVRENLAVGEYPNSPWPIERVLELFPPLKNLLGRMGGHLSGGEQQMLAIGRALMSGPKFLLLDEPSQGLAPVIVDIVVDTLVRLKNEKIGILLVEQNAEIALEIADSASIIEQGEIVHRGTALETRNNPQIMSTYLAVG